MRRTRHGLSIVYKFLRWNVPPCWPPSWPRIKFHFQSVWPGQEYVLKQIWEFSSLTAFDLNWPFINLLETSEWTKSTLIFSCFLFSLHLSKHTIVARNEVRMLSFWRCPTPPSIDKFHGCSVVWWAHPFPIKPLVPSHEGAHIARRRDVLWRVLVKWNQKGHIEDMLMLNRLVGTEW